MMLRPKERKPDYRQLLKVLHKETADRPVLFELFVCDGILEQVTETSLAGKSRFDRDCLTVQAYDWLGYDYGLVMASEMKFLSGKLNAKASYSLNGGAVIHDRNTFDRYPWPDAADYDYRHAMAKSSVAGLVVGDDWGFNTQTMLPVDIYRKYLFPWHKKIVALAHETGRPAILHSCGRYDMVIEDIIETMGYDARHSYEDNIVPVEQAYEQLYPRIAVLGGMDVNFLATASLAEITGRARGLLLQTMARGGYALGSGNSIPAYIPVPNYYAMLKAAYSPDQ